MMKKTIHIQGYDPEQCVMAKFPWGEKCVNPAHYVFEEAHETEPTYPDFLKKEDKKCAE